MKITKELQESINKYLEGKTPEELVELIERVEEREAFRSGYIDDYNVITSAINTFPMPTGIIINPKSRGGVCGQPIDTFLNSCRQVTNVDKYSYYAKVKQELIKEPEVNHKKLPKTVFIPTNTDIATKGMDDSKRRSLRARRKKRK